MAVLASELKTLLQRAVLQAREASEDAARAALQALRVDDDKVSVSLDDDRKRLRRALRARMRQLGTFNELVMEVAYEQWHLMLFARFLAENDLLMHPEAGVAVSIAECGELAADHDEPDEWMVAARFASAMLPGIFRPDDPSLQVRFAQEGRARLERALAGLPSAVFSADDSLGWVYQFWQAEAKRLVNVSERKVGGADLAPVTQLFTENYMVRFLLQNSLGAWWAARHPDSPLVATLDYLRLDGDGKPAAGTFDAWPSRACEVTVADPCCGSGHFLVEAFGMLVAMRMEEEHLDAATAGDAVLRDNLFGLELDPRCTQIAAFALALAAWKTGGYRSLPLPNVACSGIAAEAPLDSWKQLAALDTQVEDALGRLHHLFRHAETLGSLINPPRAARREDLFDVEFSDLAPTLEKALLSEGLDPATAVFGAAAAGIARAASLLSRQYWLVATNVPYLTTQSQTEVLRQFSEQNYSSARHDLATTFVLRLGELAHDSGAVAVVSPQGWSYQPVYEAFRRELLTSWQWNAFVKLGARAFEGISGEVVSVSLLVATIAKGSDFYGVGLDLSQARGPSEKAEGLRDEALHSLSQSVQRRNPDSRIIIEADTAPSTALLAEFADSYYGLGTGDYARFGRKFWEVPEVGTTWALEQSTVPTVVAYGGREHVIRWERGKGELARYPGAFIRNTHVWGSAGVCVSLTGALPATLYTGEPWDSNCAAVIPKRSEYREAVWAFLSSPEFAVAVRRIDGSLKVMNHTLLKVPFDHEYWRRRAAENGPIPEPHSADPTQWVFDGRPQNSTEALQVAVARMLGYRWPSQEIDDLDSLGDADGLVPLPTVPNEVGAAERLRKILQAAFGGTWGPVLDELLAARGGRTLDDWLREKFFEQHINLFHKRPFIWHIWDGRKDGFAALVNYHKLDRALLEKLTYSMLGSWVEMQQAEARSGTTGADLRLAAARDLQRRLEEILVGDSPHDVYVRWKPVSGQPIGWEPDLDDGVRLNIRPFVEADVLRLSAKRMRTLIKWGTDRGKNPDGSTRSNDEHLSLAEKQEARGR
jgi:hypothetical protein